MNPLLSYISERYHGVPGSQLGTPCVMQSIVIHLSRYEPGTEPDLDKTLGLLSALKAHKRTTVLLQDRCNYYVLYETDKNLKRQENNPMPVIILFGSIPSYIRK